MRLKPEALYEAPVFDVAQYIFKSQLKTANFSKYSLSVTLIMAVSVIDFELLKKNKDFKQLKDSYVIFIYKHDKFKKGLTLYHVDRVVREIEEAFNDGSVNGKYKGNDYIGRLMKDYKEIKMKISINTRVM